MDNDRSKSTRLITWPLIFVTFIGGIISYLAAGLAPDDALYQAVNLFKFSVDEEHMNLGIRIFRWIAPLSVATTLFVEIAPLFSWVRDRLVFFFSSDKTIIYSDCGAGQALYESMGKKAVLQRACTRMRISDRAKRSVIIMKNDEDALNLFRHLDGMDNIYLCLNSMEPGLLPSSGNTVVCNLNDITAGYFWHKEFMSFKGEKADKGLPAWRDRDGVPVFKKDRNRRFEIIIRGYGRLGKRLLYKGLLNNIFSPGQHIIYHVYDPEHNSAYCLEDIKNATSFNGDEVIFYDDQNELRSVEVRADAIILPERPDPEQIQELLNSTKKPELYYYDPDGIRLETVFGGESKTDTLQRLHGFGADSDILKKEYIFHSTLIERAKKINEDYRRENPGMGQKWEELSGFLKGANVNCADYMEIGAQIRSWESFSIEELSCLEHVRWCRYYDLNHKSRAGKEHLFVPYEELSEEEKQKDTENVRRWGEL